MPTPLTPEQAARHLIDRMLEDAGWQVQSRDRLNLRLHANQHVTPKEHPCER